MSNRKTVDKGKKPVKPGTSSTGAKFQKGESGRATPKKPVEKGKKPVRTGTSSTGAKVRKITEKKKK